MAGDITGFDLPDDWYQMEEILFDMLVQGNDELGNDHRLQDLFDEALFDPDATGSERYQANRELRDYLWEEYRIDFDSMFDWEDFKAWYDAQ